VNGNNWRQLYRTAILEINRDKLRERVKAAEEAILYRVSFHAEIPNEERIALRDAVSALSILKRERSSAPMITSLVIFVRASSSVTFSEP
jgi:hypothetical protein